MSYLAPLDYAVESAVQATTNAYSEVFEELTTTAKHLASQNRSLKDEVLLLRKELASTKAITNPAQHKSSFKGSRALQEAMSKATALQRSLDHALAQEQQDWEQQQIQAIHRRTKKLLEENEYQKALQSDFATAQSAIHRRKAEVQQHGVNGHIGISGEFVKGLFDKEDQTFFCFEQLFSSSVEINGSEYAVVKADLSSIGAGHTYYLSPARGGL